MRFEVLGPVTVRTDAGTAVAVPEAKVRALLAALLAYHPAPVSADRLVDDLWGSRPPGNPYNTLQTKVSHLRRALERGEPGGREMVAYLPAGYLLQVEDEGVDAGRFTSLVTRARRTSDARERAALLGDALDLWRGAAFADFPDAEFAQAAAVRLEELRVTAQEELAEVRLGLGEFSRVADDLAEVVGRHPLRERLRAAHMRALYGAGRQAEALAGYDELRERLADELGLDPGGELAGLRQAILVRDAALGEADPRSDSPGLPRTLGNLPAPDSAPFGREDAITRVRELLDAGRLVTLTGPGGVGKTRLALAAARMLADVRTEFPDGAWVVEFAAEKGDLARAVAAVLGLRDAVGPAGHHESRETADPELDLLADALPDRRLLLVLDNCEHVVDEAAALAARLLRDAHGVRILATSQEPLAIAGEVVEAVAPLDEDAAVDLFAARATAAAPGFRVDDANRATVAAICRRLDNLPLAVELAAGRVRALGVEELARRLDDRFRVLGSGRRDAPSRHRTMRAAIDWSWEALGDDERAVLRRLGAFWNGCTLEAAEAVCGEPANALGGNDVIDAVVRLVDRSLVTVVPGEAGPRYRLLESVAAYSRERLDEAGETKATELLHARYFVELALRARPMLHSSEQRHWLARLDDESADLRVAVEASLTHGRVGDALRLVNALTWYWMLRGRLTEAIRALDAAIAAADRDGAPEPTADHADALAYRAGFALLTGDGTYGVTTPPPNARPHAAWFLASARVGFGDTADVAPELARLLEEFLNTGDTWGQGAVHHTLGAMAVYDGDLQALRTAATAAADLFREIGDSWGELQATEHLGILAEIAGDYPEAARLHRTAIAAAEDLRLWLDMSFRLARLGRIALLTDDLDAADKYHTQAARLAAEQSHKPAEQFATTGLAITARRRGDLDRAEDLLQPWLEWNRRLDVPAGEALILAQLGLTAEARGDATRATQLQTSSYHAATRTGDPRAVAFALEGLAGARSLTGAHTQAASLLGTAAALRTSAGSPLPKAERTHVDHIAAQAEAALGKAPFHNAFTQGAHRAPETQVERTGQPESA